MPSRNALKSYVEDGCYHVYNRGIDKRLIFVDKYDYGFFLRLLKDLLTARDSIESQKGTAPSSKANYANEIDLFAYCLMPNHFHLLIKQKKLDSMSRFIKSLSNNYSNYFNKKYGRVGTLFQGRYKAVIARENDQIIHLSKYIHCNPQGILEKGTVPFSDLSDYDYSSYQDYLGLKNTKWLKSDFILSIVSNSIGDSMASNYKKFVEGNTTDSGLILGRLQIDD